LLLERFSRLFSHKLPLMTEKPCVKLSEPFWMDPSPYDFGGWYIFVVDKTHKVSYMKYLGVTYYYITP